MPVTKRILARRFETANQIRATKKQKTLMVSKQHFLEPSWPLILLQFERSLCLCAVKPGQTPRSCTKFLTKTRQNPRVDSVCWWQNVAMPQKAIRRQLFKAFSTMLKTACQWLMSSAFAWCRFRWPWAACPTTAHTGGSKRTCFLCLYPYACIWHNRSLFSF